VDSVRFTNVSPLFVQYFLAGRVPGLTCFLSQFLLFRDAVLSQNSYREGVGHYLVISLDLTQLSLHIKPCVCLQTNISTGQNPGTSWKRLPGRLRKTSTSQIPDDTGMSPRAYWDASIYRGHWRGTLRSLKTTRWRWWWWWWRYI